MVATPHAIEGVTLRRIGSAQSKHVPRESQHEAEFQRLANHVGYKYAIVGVAQGHTTDEDRLYVRELASLPRLRPLKFVITKDGRLWADNTHWSLAALRRQGPDCRIQDVPHYIIDLRAEPTIHSKPASLMGEALAKALHNALRIQQRLDKGWRPEQVSYTLSELFRDGSY